MQKARFVCVGHIVDDVEPYHHVGGGVSYSAVCARKLGCEAHIITKCPNDHPYIKVLEKKGVIVHNLPHQKTSMTSFSNIYDTAGKRTQKAYGQQEPITLADFENFPKNLINNSINLIATVIGEVDLKLFPKIAEKGILTVTPQGYFRSTKDDGTVFQKEWHGFKNYLSSSAVTILSTEDLPTDNKKIIHDLITTSKLTVITDGENGSTVYHLGKKIKTGAFTLQKAEVNSLTGAGDTYAAAFICNYITYKNPKLASVFASLYTAVKIIGIDGIGVSSIPSLSRVKTFIKNSEKRVRGYLSANHVGLDLLLLSFK